MKANFATKPKGTVNNLKQPQYIASLISDAEKFANEKEKVKKLVEYYEQLGWNQVINKRERFKKLYNLAYGVINPEDYVDLPKTADLAPHFNAEQLKDVKLNFYPIIPNIVNVLSGEIEKKELYYHVQAINPEATNEVLEMKNQEIRETLVTQAENKFLASIDPKAKQEEIDQRMELFHKLPEIQEYYKTSFRPTIEKWANHTIALENERFNMRQLSRKMFESLLITEHPYVHVSLTGDSYFPEVLEPHNVFYLKSPFTDDVSESMMAGWFSYENVSTIISKYGHLLKEEDITKIQGWNGRLLTNLVPNNTQKNLTGSYTDYVDSANNYLTMKGWETYTQHERYDEYGQTLARITNMYLLLPKKVGKLTYKKGEDSFQDIVDENYKITEKPVYSTKVQREKNEYTLISGEHVEWSHINELWRCIKIDFSASPNFTRVLDTDEKTNSMFILLERHPIQYKKKGRTFGVSIPIHGGPSSNLYNRSISLVEKCANWQVLYNFLWNRNSQLLSTEIGSFFVFDQAELPNESLGETWNKNPMKVFKVAQDTSLAPFDRSLTNMGQNSGFSGSFGQVVDLTKTKEVIEKANLAAMIKQECYQLIGITPQQLGDISPYQSAKTVTQGLQRSNTQIQYLFTRHADIMKLVRETMLETAQYLVSRQDTVEFTYTSDQGERVVFKTRTDDFSLYDLGIFVRNEVNDLETLERIKDLAVNDNTMGASAFEKASILSARYVTDLMDKLRKIELEKEAKDEAKMKHEQELLQQKIEADQLALDKKMQFEASESTKDRQANMAIAQVKALGYAQSDADTISKEIMQLQDSSLKQQQLYNSFTIANRAQELAAQKQKAQTFSESENAKMDQNLKMKELQLREKEIRASENRTQAMLHNEKEKAKEKQKSK